ncbi:MAG: metallophosphoesterase [Planctomycetota bacterium]
MPASANATHEASNAFLDATYGIGPDRVVCLGDIIGDGADPVACVDLARTFRMCLCGCREEALVEGIATGGAVERAFEWTRRQFDPDTDAGNRARREFLSALPRKVCRTGPWEFVHGTPRDPTMEYVLSVDTEPVGDQPSPKIREIFSMVDHVCFIAHSHQPGLIVQSGSARWFTPAECDHEVAVGDAASGPKYLINVGSVGRPADGDPCACVVVMDEALGTARWHRVPYDVEATIQRMLAVPELAYLKPDRLRGSL